jgi:hypothetical protein
VPAEPQPGIQSISPVEPLNVAPAGSDGLTLHVTGPLAHPPSVAAGVIASACPSATACEAASPPTLTLPASRAKLALIVWLVCTFVNV